MLEWSFMSRRLRFALLLGLCAAVAGAGLWAYKHRTHPAKRLADRVILLGFDGAAPNLIEPLVAQGLLPNLKRLMDEGAYGALRSFSPTKSAILWTLVATGKTMLKHGIIDWTYVSRAGLAVPYQDRERRVKTYWEILAERGVSTGTLNWWMSYPPPPIWGGYIVSNAFRHTPEPHTVHPRQLFDAINPLRVDRGQTGAHMARLGIPEWRKEDVTLPLHNARHVLEAHRLYVAQDVTNDRVSDFLFEKQPVEVFSTYFRLVDVTNHFAVHFANRKIYDEAAALEQRGQLDDAAEHRIDAELARVMAPAYRFMDGIVGKYLAHVDERTLLIVCSDHGFRFFKGAYAHAHLSMQPPDGVVFLAGAGVEKGARLTGPTLYDVAPTILWAVGQPVGEDMDGTVLRPAFGADALRRFSVRSIPTFESGERLKGERRAGDQALDSQVLDDLKTLGYIGDQP